MRARPLQSAFSLIEVMFAIGVLAVGVLFVGGTFTLGVHYSVVASEKAMAPVIAEEAFAKIRLYGLPAASINYEHTPFSFVDSADDVEFYYPSTVDKAQGILPSTSRNQYSWCAITLPLPSGEFRVTVFALRRQGGEIVEAKPIEFQKLGEQSMVGATVVIDRDLLDPPPEYRASARIVQIVDSQGRRDMQLDPPLETELDPADIVWTVIPDQGRNPVIGVYQMDIRF